MVLTDVSTAPAAFDTDRPSWAAYDDTRYLGTLHAQVDLDGVWYVQSTRERHLRLDDAVRALRRPPTWPEERERVRRWARTCLDDLRLLVLDVQTTGLGDAWAVQIGLTDRYGTALIDEVINPLNDIEPAAARLHGITHSRVSASHTFSTLLPDLTRLITSRRCVAYNAPFDRGVLERELRRHYNDPLRARAWLQACSFEDAMHPYATWK
ncbi:MULTISPECIES: exonuclease domain-containing protein [unclassified Streptomyces]|uniref:3'-5' exonuclease n=1 Tax=unclassified Streptomyces TaxID=2593676 RepID=UPI0036EFD700